MSTELHAECHDLVCNAGREYPRGAKGVSCSCRSREKRESAEREELKAQIAALQAAEETLTAELRKAQHRNELERRVYDRLMLCPDHRDKANGTCIVCMAETRTRQELRAELAALKTHITDELFVAALTAEADRLLDLEDGPLGDERWIAAARHVYAALKAMGDDPALQQK